MTNRQQFDEFITKHLDNAYKLANIYVKNPSDAEDVVAESIEKALRNIDALDDPVLMRGWFNKIVINESINHLRKQSRIASMSKSIPIYHFDDLSHIDFESLLDLLPADDRQIVNLRFGEDHKLGEIAEILGMNENTVKTRLYRSLKKLRLELTDEGCKVNVKKDRIAVKTVSVVLVAVLLSAALVFNLSPSLSAAAYDIPVIGDIVRIITFNRFEYKAGGYEAEILVPEIQGLLDPELQDRLNAEFREYADELILSFEAAIPEIEDLGLEELNGKPAHMSIKADYEVKTDNERILSIDAYIYSDVNGFVIHKFCTIDKQAGILVTFPWLFKKDADYITPISRYILAEMTRINEEEDGQFNLEDSPFGGFAEISLEQNFYINDDGELIICFDKYEVAPGSAGSPEFVIPAEIITDIAAAERDLLMLGER